MALVVLVLVVLVVLVVVVDTPTHKHTSVEYKKSPLAYGLITFADSKLPHLQHFLEAKSLHRFYIIV